MTTTFRFVTFLALLVSAGCSHNHVFAPIDADTAIWATAIADDRAQIELDEFNAKPNVESYGGPFSPDQYSREMIRSNSRANDILVMYKLREPVDFLGHPQHFTVYVSPEGSTRLSRGR